MRVNLSLLAGEVARPLPLRVAYLGAATSFITAALVMLVLLMGHTLPRSNQLAFVSGSDGNGEIYLLDVARIIEHNLTRSSVYEGQPFSWSPDGERIAYVATDGLTPGNIMVINADGGSKHNITNYDANYLSLAWSPDSHHIAFDSDREDGNFEIYVANTCPDPSGACANSVQRLTANVFREYAPVWMPDGNLILFISYSPTGRSEIHSMNADGSNVHNLTYLTTPNGGPLLSPDGKTIAFTSDNGTYEIYALDAGCLPPSTRPDSRIPRGCESTLRNLSEHRADDWLPVWSPDSQELVFLSWRDGNTEIYRLNIASGVLHRLTYHPADDRDPAWSPDGQRIAFVSDREGSYDIYVMDVNGDHVRRLTYSGVNSLPAWRP